MIFDSTNVHLVPLDGRTMLLHVPTTALFELDEVAVAVLSLVQAEAGLDAEQIRGRLSSGFTGEAVGECIDKLIDLSILRPEGVSRPINPAGIHVQAFPLSTIVLNVNTGCNLACGYCYKEDLAIPAEGKRMGMEVAARSVDLLLSQAQSRPGGHSVLRRRAAHQHAADPAGGGLRRGARAGARQDGGLLADDQCHAAHR